MASASKTEVEPSKPEIESSDDFKSASGIASLRENAELLGNKKSFKGEGNSGRDMDTFGGSNKFIFNSRPRNNTGSFFSLRFSNNPMPRIGVEWDSNSGALNGTKLPMIVYGTRFLGLYEVNSSYPTINKYGNRIVFKNLDWSDISVVTTPITATNGTLITLGTTAIIKAGLTIGVIAYVSTVPSTQDGKLLKPTAVKYSLSLSGVPRYLMVPSSASNYLLIQSTHSSNVGAIATNSSLFDGAGRLDWDTTVLADGKTMPVTLLNMTFSFSDAENRPFNLTKRSSDRDSDLDARLVTRFLTYSLPHFDSKLLWDPSISIDEVQASGSSVPKTSAGFSSKGSAMTGLAITALCFLLL